MKNGTTTLVKDKDYSISLSNNTNVGTAGVTINGIGSYNGSVNKTFNITAKNISGAEVTLSQTSYTYDGSPKTPDATVKLGGKTLVKNTDYTLNYSNNTNAGTATLTVTGKGNYTGTVSRTFTIEQSTAPTRLKGDINNDGKVNVADAMIAIQVLKGKKNLTGDDFSAADMDGDGKLKVADVLRIIRLAKS